MTEIEIFAKRLKQARILNKFSMDKLVESMGGRVSKQAISKYESAKMMPNSEVLVCLASALGVELDYFFRPFVLRVGEFKVSFRKKSNVGVKDENALTVQIQDQVERYLEIEEILSKSRVVDVPSFSAPLSSAKQMRELALELRHFWNLGYGALANVQDLVEDHGIIVASVAAPLEFDGVSGIIGERAMIIVLNSSQTHVERRRFTTMHELCHLLCNEYFSPGLSLAEVEKLCDEFANEMLLPSYVIERDFIAGAKVSMSELIRVQLEYGISIDAIMYKLRGLEFVNESRYKSFCIRKNTSPSLKREVQKSRYCENMSNKFETMVYAALAKDLITVSKAASLLNVSSSTVRKHLNAV